MTNYQISEHLRLRIEGEPDATLEMPWESIWRVFIEGNLDDHSIDLRFTFPGTLPEGSDLDRALDDAIRGLSGDALAVLLIRHHISKTSSQGGGSG